jgi:hypothetical protein
MQFQCECGTTLSVPDAAAGKKAKCPKCGKIVPVPALASPAPEPAPQPVAAPEPTTPPEPAAQPEPPPAPTPATGISWGVKEPSEEEPPAHAAGPRRPPRVARRGASARPRELPEGKLCAFCGEHDAVTACRNCQTLICAECTVKIESRNYCPDCAEDLGGEEEEYAEIGPLAAWPEVMFHPARFFKGMRRAKGIGPAVVFAAIIIVLSAFGATMWALILGKGYATAGLLPAGMVLAVFYSPLWLFIVVRLTCGVGSYAAAVRLGAYALAPLVVLAIPGLGLWLSVVAVPYEFVLLVIGLSGIFGLKAERILLVIVVFAIVMSVVHVLPLIILVLSGAVSLLQTLRNAFLVPGIGMIGF